MVDGDGIEARLDALLERVKDDDDARQQFVDLLEVLGPDDPRTATYRKRLTARSDDSAPCRVWKGGPVPPGADAITLGSLVIVRRRSADDRG